jgi:hypothetical protein
MGSSFSSAIMVNIRPKSLLSSQKKSRQEYQAAGEDKLSALPDDIPVNIVGRLELRTTVRSLAAPYRDGGGTSSARFTT